MYEKEYGEFDSELGIRRAIETLYFKKPFVTFKWQAFWEFQISHQYKYSAQTTLILKQITSIGNYIPDQY